MCDDYIGIDNLTVTCNTWGVREYVFRREPVKSLVNLYVRGTSVFNRIICITHNAGGFDAHFILKELFEERKSVLPQVILNGNNIILLQYGRTKFIDSLNYFHMKHSGLPKTFDLPPSLKKDKNQGYVGPLPTASFYAPDSMSTLERKKFFEWYDENAHHYVFYFQKELVEYCGADVEILRRLSRACAHWYSEKIF